MFQFLKGLFSSNQKEKESRIVLNDIWDFNKEEFINYCINNNAYVTCIEKIINDKLNSTIRKVDTKRFVFNNQIVKRFISMLSHKYYHIHPIHVDDSDENRKENSRSDFTNTCIYEGFQAIKVILDSDCYYEIAKSLAERYITIPYETKKC